tara:strand:+ start:342 stop:1166 length:825 start_codon:yes stop_codon:yes gene_type:complete
MSNKFQIKRTAVAGRVPNTSDSADSTYIDNGELAINTADGILYSSDGSSLLTLSVDTTYSVGDGGLTQKNFTTTLKDKLDAIATDANLYVLPDAVSANKFSVTSGNGNGYTFSGTADTYSIQMGNNQEDHGTVTDYSMHFTMGSEGVARGFTFGPTRTTVKASINAATGAFLSNDNITAYSDARIKDNIEVIPNALNKLQQISGYTYTRTDVEDKDKKYTGVIAQEVLKVLPEAVELGTSEDDTMSVAYGNMVGLLIEAVKELKSQVDELRESI